MQQFLRAYSALHKPIYWKSRLVTGQGPQVEMLRAIPSYVLDLLHDAEFLVLEYRWQTD